MESGSTTPTPSQTPTEALAVTDRTLRRLLRHVTETTPNPGDDLEKTIKRAKRQLRTNKDILGDTGTGDKPANEPAAFARNPGI